MLTFYWLKWMDSNLQENKQVLGIRFQVFFNLAAGRFAYHKILAHGYTHAIYVFLLQDKKKAHSRKFSHRI